MDFRLPNPKPLNLEFIELMWDVVSGGKKEGEKERTFSVSLYEVVWD